MQPILAQRLLANLEIVGAVLGDIGWQSVDVVSSGNGLESVQMQRTRLSHARESTDCDNPTQTSISNHISIVLRPIDLKELNSLRY